MEAKGKLQTQFVFHSQSTGKGITWVSPLFQDMHLKAFFCIQIHQNQVGDAQAHISASDTAGAPPDAFPPPRYWLQTANVCVAAMINYTLQSSKKR